MYIFINHSLYPRYSRPRMRVWSTAGPVCDTYIRRAGTSTSQPAALSSILTTAVEGGSVTKADCKLTKVLPSGTGAKFKFTVHQGLH